MGSECVWYEDVNVCFGFVDNASEKMLWGFGLLRFWRGVPVADSTEICFWGWPGVTFSDEIR